VVLPARWPASPPPHPLSAVAGVDASGDACPGTSLPATSVAEVKRAFFQEANRQGPTVGAAINQCSHGRSRLTSLNSLVTPLVRLPCASNASFAGAPWTFTKCDFEDFNGWADAADEALRARGVVLERYKYRCVCVCVCVCARACGWVGVCVCVGGGGGGVGCAWCEQKRGALRAACVCLCRGVCFGGGVGDGEGAGEGGPQQPSYRRLLGGAAGSVAWHSLTSVSPAGSTGCLANLLTFAAPPPLQGLPAAAQPVRLCGAGLCR
jgi:hypothetical protein